MFLGVKKEVTGSWLIWDLKDYGLDMVVEAIYIVEEKYLVVERGILSFFVN